MLNYFIRLSSFINTYSHTVFLVVGTSHDKNRMFVILSMWTTGEKQTDLLIFPLNTQQAAYFWAVFLKLYSPKYSL